MKIMIENCLFDCDDIAFGEIPKNTINIEPGDEVEILLDGLPRQNYKQNWIVENIYYIGLDDSDAYGVDLFDNPYMFTNKDLKLIKKRKYKNYTKLQLTYK
jgi:hypothetical protein